VELVQPASVCISDVTKATLTSIMYVCT